MTTENTADFNANVGSVPYASTNEFPTNTKNTSKTFAGRIFNIIMDVASKIKDVVIKVIKIIDKFILGVCVDSINLLQIRIKKLNVFISHNKVSKFEKIMAKALLFFSHVALIPPELYLMATSRHPAIVN